MIGDRIVTQAWKKGGATQMNNPAGYAGDLSPRAAWDLLAKGDAVLVDCRSPAEWSFVGVPDLATLGKRPLLVAWQHWTEAGMRMNPNFVADLRAAGAKPDQKVIFLCRSGGRSRSAAIAVTQAGFSSCFNLAGGFEGAHDAAQHRGSTQGWKADGLPWKQD